MDLRSLRYFIAVLEAGSLSKAAAMLYVAQPALTAQIKKLEQDLGARLLERSHAGVTPTPAGTQLYQDARRLLSDAAAIRERLQRSADSPEGSVTIAIPFLLVTLLMGRLIERVRDAYPRIRIFVLDGLSLRVQKAMLDGRADIGVLVDTPRLEGMRCEPLATEALYLAGLDKDGAARALAEDGPEPRIAFRDAARLPLVLQSRRYAIRQSVENAAAEHGITLNVVHEQDSARVIRSLYLAGAGYTFTPACALHDVPVQHDPDWFRARVGAPDILRHYSVAMPLRGEPTPASRLVARMLREEVRNTIAEGAWDAEPAPLARTEPGGA
ncbi:LysR family transcriptional regulator [Verticiella sediminum]|uniref:LysR family transcriptional regulator n=1 Tax=Verticiella sediminum TaxID=1247510 RepID=A0A556AB49_9BURK|nr:LysR family transcriptional regulator [Verticiella sediminum]TSH90108.1 LysR family transcriptional regulator [Verticiella sediminum]